MGHIEKDITIQISKLLLIIPKLLWIITKYVMNHLNEQELIQIASDSKTDFYFGYLMPISKITRPY